MWLNYMNWKSMDECCEINWVHYILGGEYEYCCDEFPHGKFQLTESINECENIWWINVMQIDRIKA
jgi:hypothetical protein